MKAIWRPLTERRATHFWGDNMCLIDSWAGRNMRHNVNILEFVTSRGTESRYHTILNPNWPFLILSFVSELVQQVFKIHGFLAAVKLLVSQQHKSVIYCKLNALIDYMLATAHYDLCRKYCFIYFLYQKLTHIPINLSFWINLIFWVCCTHFICWTICIYIDW